MTLFKRQPKPVAPHAHQWDTDSGYSIGYTADVPTVIIRCSFPGCKVGRHVDWKPDDLVQSVTQCRYWHFEQMLVEGGVK